MRSVPSDIPVNAKNEYAKSNDEKGNKVQIYQTMDSGDPEINEFSPSVLNVEIQDQQPRRRTVVD